MKLPSEIFDPLPAGVCDFETVEPYLLDVRSRSRLPADAKSVICVLFPYYLGEEYYRDLNMSRYAVSEDYHIVAREMIASFTEKLGRLFPGAVFEGFTDSSPLPEVRCAVACSLGVIGKNRLCINPVYGSWFFIGEIVTDMRFETTPPENTECPGCGECLRACPTGALSDGGLDPERCLSALTQKKGELSEETKRLMRKYNTAWGCDVCQVVCPMNVNKKPTPIARFYETAGAVFDPDNAEGNRAFMWRGEKTARRNARVMKGEDEDGV